MLIFDYEIKSTVIPAGFGIRKAKKIEISYYGEFIGDHLSISDLLKDDNKRAYGKANSTSQNIRF